MLFKRSQTGSVIIGVYVDDLNIVSTFELITKDANDLKNEFEIKNLGKTKFCLRVQVMHLSSGIFINQSTNTKRFLISLTWTNLID